MPTTPTFDMNTSLVTVDGAPPGEWYRPLRYTTTKANSIRVGVYVMLATPLGTYDLDTQLGQDMETILDPLTSDAERGALVADVVGRYPGVDSIEGEPIVTIVNGELASIQVTGRVGEETFTIGFAA